MFDTRERIGHTAVQAPEKRTQNATLIAAAFGRVHDDAVVQNAVKADGIRADGSFGQHTGIIYNGNYGKD